MLVVEELQGYRPLEFCRLVLAKNYHPSPPVVCSLFHMFVVRCAPHVVKGCVHLQVQCGRLEALFFINDPG